MPEIFLILSAVLIALGLLYLIFVRKSKRASPSRGPSLGALPKIAYCPLCGSGMEGNKLFSKQILYRDGRKMLEIRGCRLCYKEGGGKPRTCPSCKTPMGGSDDYLLAELTQAGNTLKVAVKGCRKCHGR